MRLSVIDSASPRCSLHLAPHHNYHGNKNFGGNAFTLALVIAAAGNNGRDVAISTRQAARCLILNAYRSRFPFSIVANLFSILIHQLTRHFGLINEMAPAPAAVP